MAPYCHIDDVNMHDDNPISSTTTSSKATRKVEEVGDHLGRPGMAPNHPPIPPAAEPIRKTFDPWNSSSTGHQRAENRLGSSTSWRVSRTVKLRNQFASGPSGGKRIFDTVGAGSKDFGRDGRRENGSWEKGAPGLREPGWRDVGTMLSRGSKVEEEARQVEKEAKEEKYPETKLGISEEPETDEQTELVAKPRGIFNNLGFYINGSTAPTVSDHKLKQMLSENGGNVCLGLARRRVTHVIIGRPHDLRGGAGGGLSGTKIQKEIQRIRGCGIRYVNVEWVMESLKAGKRLPEYQYKGVNTAPYGVKSVVSMFEKQEKLKG